MSTVIFLPVAPGVAATPAQRRIEVVPGTQQHTLVVRSGAARRCLRFNEAVTGLELRTYCRENFGWKGLDDMQLTADGQVFSPDQVGDVTLQPATAKVEFAQTMRPKSAEFRRTAPDKG